MMGATLMTLPWAFENAGLVASLIMLSIVGAVSYYTCFLILDWGFHGKFTDFSDVCAYYLGGWSKHVANATSVGVCTGVLAAYHVLMASSVNNIIISIGDIADTKVTFLCCGSGSFEYLVSSIFIAVCVFPFLCFRSIGWLMNLASFGSLSVLYNCCFIIGNAFWYWPSADTQKGKVIKEAGDIKDFGVFFGTLGLSLFVHNLVLQMGYGHSCALTKPAIVKRDVGIAYCIAVACYIFVGAVPAMVLELGGDPYQYLVDGQLNQNILLSYDHKSVGALIGKALLLLQIFVVYPLIATVIRRQFFASVTGTDWPGWTKAITFSAVLVGFTTTVSSVYPEPGHVVGYVGVYTAIVYMLTLPFLVHVTALKAMKRPSKLAMVVHGLIWVVMTVAFLLQFL